MPVMVTCYLRKHTVYIPTIGKVERSYYRHIEPVSMIPIAEIDELRQAFQQALARGNPIVPPLPIHNPPPPLLLKYAGVKNYSAFERGTSTWNIEEKDGDYKIAPYRRRADRGWEQDRGNIIILPPGSHADDAIDRMIAILQAHADT